jgi:hypothetical protein
MANNTNTKASNADVDAWLSDQIEAIRLRYVDQPDEFELAVGQLYADRLTAGRYQEYRYCDMATTERYSLPLIARRAIIVFQREHNFLEPRRGGDVAYSTLFDMLQISDSTSTALPQFLKLCRRKVDAFVKNNGTTWRRIGAVQKLSSGIQWEAWTNSWLQRDWDGVINPPFCQHCGHRNEGLSSGPEGLPDIASPHYESLRGMISSLDASIRELSNLYMAQLQRIEHKSNKDLKQEIDEIDVNNTRKRQKRRKTESEM